MHEFINYDILTVIPYRPSVAADANRLAEKMIREISI